MEPSQFLKEEAENAIKEGKISFLFGDVEYNITDKMPVKVNVFFSITENGKEYVVYA